MSSADMSSPDMGSAEASATCASCGTRAPGEDQWCENCGEPLRPAVGAPVATSPCVSCGASVPVSPSAAATADRWCPECGQRQPIERDHFEISEGAVAAVTDRGLRHHQNEDAVAIAARPDGAIMVVSDGVSSTDHPDAASQAACDATLATLVARWDEHNVSGDVRGLAQFESWMVDAVVAANDAIAQIIADAGALTGESPSCTLVATAVRKVGDLVIGWVGWLGDSRAYWISGLDGEMLTTDHSWAQLQVDQGDASPEEIAADPRANSIVRWIGPDSPNPGPEVRRFEFAVPGRVILCTDGLWRYCDSAEEMAHRSAEAGNEALEAARNLSDFALTSGGHDNISVAVFDTGTVSYLQTAAAQSSPQPME